MAVHKDHGLLVYVNVSPSEQIVFKSTTNLSFKNNNKWSMVGVVEDEDEGMLGLKQYKLGAWKKKMVQADTIIKAIEQKI